MQLRQTNLPIWMRSAVLVIALIGPGIGLRGIYFSHVLILLALVCAVAANVRIPLTEVRRHHAALSVLLVAVAYLMFEAAIGAEPVALTKHMAILFVSVSTMVATYSLVRYTQSSARSILALETFIWLLVVFCAIESTTGLRLPVSRYSEGSTDASLSDSIGGDQFWHVPTAFFGNENNLALLLLLLLAATPLIARSRRPVLLLAQSTLVVMTGSRIALLMLLPAAVLYAWSVGVRAQRLILCAVGVVCVATVLSLSSLACDEWLSPKMCLLVGVASERPDLLLLESGNDSIGVRASLWVQAVEVLERNPWFGIGPGSLSAHIAAEHFEAGTITNAHNPPLEVLAEYGWVGVWLWVLPYLMLVRFVVSAPDSRIRRCTLAVLLLLPLASPTVSSMYYFTPVWALIGILCGLVGRSVTIERGYD